MNDWRPGTVALVEGDVCLQMQSGDGWEHGYASKFRHPVTADARRLVVIDPEDREQVERLVSSLEALSFSVWGCGTVSAAQAALREFAKPTPTCKAALIIRGEHFACDQKDGHGMQHANAAAGAIWGES